MVVPIDDWYSIAVPEVDRLLVQLKTIPKVDRLLVQLKVLVTGKYDTFFFSKVWSSLLIKYK